MRRRSRGASMARRAIPVEVGGVPRRPAVLAASRHGMAFRTPSKGYRIHTSVSVGSVLHASACPRLSRPGGALHRICHGMSCFVMRGVRMARPDRACCGRPGPAFRVFCPVSPACGFRHRSLLSIRLRFVFPPPGCPARGPHYAARNRARAGGRVGAGAVRAPDCARVRPRASPSAGRTSPARPIGGFPRWRRCGRERPPETAPGLLFCFHSRTPCQIASLPPMFFHNFLSRD